MKIRIDRRSINDWLVYIAVSLYVAVSIVTTTFFSKYIPGSVYHLVSIVSISLLILYNILTIKNTKGIGVGVFGALFILVMMSLLIYASTGSFQTYIYSLIIIFLLKDFDFKKLVNFVLPVIIGTFIFVIISSKVGIIQDYIEISGSRTRHYLGFRYSLFPSTVMLNIVGLYLYSKQEKISYKSLIVLSVSVLWIFLQTASRLAALSSAVFLVIGFSTKCFPNLLTKLRYILVFLLPSYIFGALASYIIAGKYVTAGSGLRALNSFLGGRIYLASKSLYTYGFGWVGKNIQWIGNGLNNEGKRSTLSYLYVDNMYIQVLQKYGLLYLIIFVILLTISMLILYRQKQYLLVLLLSVLAMHATIDDLTFNLYYNLFLVFLAFPFAIKNVKFEKIDVT